MATTRTLGILPRRGRTGQRWSLVLLLAVLALALAACAPASPPTPSPAPSPSPEIRPTRSPLLPTWTPLPSSTPAPPPTPTPTFPPPAPTPTPAPPLNPAMQVGTFFFFWHNCPQQNCYPNLAYAIPPGWTEPFALDPDAGDGTGYSSLNRYWYLQELRDMRLAGIEVVLPVSWGDHPFPWFRTSVLRQLVEANREMGPPLKIGFFDDTSSEVNEYHDYADNGRLDFSAYFATGPDLDLSSPVSGFFFYDRKIRPFFSLVPQEMWATHNGLPVEQGGQPLIVVYVAQGISHLELAGELWSAVKDAFQRDFHDRNGQPITPWIILEESWFTQEALEADPSLDTVADGRYVWGTALLGPKVREWHGYTVASTGPGFDDRKYKGKDGGREQPRWITPDGQEGDPGAFLSASLAQVPPQTNLLLVETWNELWEGTFVARAAYPEMAGRPVVEDFYIDLLRRSLRGQGLWWAAQLLPPSRPLRLAAGHTYRLVLPVRNVGTRTWSSAGGEHLVLGGNLLPGEQDVSPAEPVRPGEVGQFSATMTTPAAVGSYTLTWQMVGPEGPFSAPAAWNVPVEAAVLSATMKVAVPLEPVRVGSPFTLTVGLDRDMSILAVRLRVRFDPAVLRLEELQPLLGGPFVYWRTEVDNERGVGTLEVRGGLAELTRRLAGLQWQALQSGDWGIWVEQVELRLEEGDVWTLDPQWVPLEVLPSP